MFQISIISIFCFKKTSVFTQEHEKKREDRIDDPFDLDNRPTELPASQDQKSTAISSGYGAIANGDSKATAVDGKVDHRSSF